MPLKGDARQKLNQMNRGRGGNSSSNVHADSRGPTNVKDLRQIIKKKSNPREDRVASGRITKNSGSNSRMPSRDLRDTNRRLASRKSSTSSGPRSTSKSRPDRQPKLSPAIAQEVVKAAWAAVSDYTRLPSSHHDNSSNNKKPQRPLYVPPHMKHHAGMQQYHHQSEPRVIVLAPGATPQTSKLAMDNHHHHVTPHRQQNQEQGASVLISNLVPSITQSEIIELFGDIGTLTGVNMINQTTALVSYQNSSDAVRAVKVYNNRSLDGKPMYVNMMPNYGSHSDN